MHWDILAGLRFFLAWIVFSCHVSDFVTHRDFLIRFDYFGGHAAVLVFLLVSGYSIAHSVSKSTKGFYKRRLLRIYPLYLAAIVISLVPFLVSGQNIKEYSLPSITNFIGNLFFLQGFSVNALASNVIIWTLSIEIFCYLLAPLFLKLGYKKLLLLVAVSSICYIIFPRISLGLGDGRTNSLYGIPLLLLLWAWLLGFVFYLQAHQKAMQILLIGLGCALIISSYNYYGVGKLAIVTYILSALILIYSSHLQLPIIGSRVFRYLGDLSYPFYLFHFPSILFGYKVLGMDNSFYQLILSLIVSVIAYHLIDVPLRHNKESSRAAIAFSKKQT
jgi:peptidoglycan/LPS O-acetylase OafA/YrhL